MCVRAGAPILDPVSGQALGTLCVYDDHRRDLSEPQRVVLLALARQASIALTRINTLLEHGKDESDRPIDMEQAMKDLAAAYEPQNRPAAAEVQLEERAVSTDLLLAAHPSQQQPPAQSPAYLSAAALEQPLAGELAVVLDIIVTVRQHARQRAQERMGEDASLNVQRAHILSVCVKFHYTLSSLRASSLPLNICSCLWPASYWWGLHACT